MFAELSANKLRLYSSSCTMILNDILFYFIKADCFSCSSVNIDRGEWNIIFVNVDWSCVYFYSGRKYMHVCNIIRGFLGFLNHHIMTTDI